MLVLASAASAYPTTVTEIVIPADGTATLSGAEFCADDPLTYGYTLNGGPLQPVAYHAASGSGQCETVTGTTTITPGSTQPTTLRVYLTDTLSSPKCDDTYYSDGTGDGNHALVTQESSSTYDVSIMDCYVGNATTGTRLPTANGAGNLNVAVTVQAPPPPTATISSPPGGGTYTVGEEVPTGFSCAEGASGPGLSSCDDNNPTSPTDTTAGGSGTLDTATPGTYTYTVTATSSDGQSNTASISYHVAGPPTATISSPASGGTYYVGESVTTGFSCSDSTYGSGISSCTDSRGNSHGSGTLNTATLGNYTYTVTATSTDGQSNTASISYHVAGPPTATISSPPGGGTYTVGEEVPTGFSCSDSTYGSGISSCTDSRGNSHGSGTLNTSTLGNYTYTVTATSTDGQSNTASISYTVADPPTATITTPADNQAYDLNQPVGTAFSCTEGTDGPGLTHCTDSNGVSGGTGTLVTSTAGTSLPYTVTATSADGQTGTRTIHYTVVYVAPTNSALPMVSGTAQEDDTLSATTGTWSGDPAPTYTYQWDRCKGSSCGAISGAVASSYVASLQDVGYTLEVVVTATNPGGHPTATSAQTPTVLIAAPVNSTLPTISGTAQQGATLSATLGSWANSPATYVYQWEQCTAFGAACAPISGVAATMSSYVAASTDVGHTLVVVVTAYNAGGFGSATSLPTPAVAPPGYPGNSTLPTITGTAQQDQSLSAGNGTWTNSPTGYAYQWEDCDASGAHCGSISGAMASSYVPGPTDVGDTLRVIVTASNTAGSASATSAPSAVVSIAPPVPTAAPAVSGAAVQSQPLLASNGAWQNSPTTYTYQWLQCGPTGANCNPIPGATLSSYVPGPGDAGHALRVTVTASNSSGKSSATSFPTDAVPALPAAAPQVSNAPPPPPVLDSSTNLNPVSGTILIRLPGSKTFTPVPVGTNVPIGSTVDALNGVVLITVALPNGKTQTGEFYAGEFVLTQSPSGTTIPILTGGSFSGCPAPTKTGARNDTARAAGSKKKKTTVVRQLWGNAHGNYTTKGRYGSASVSGTIWLVQDRCDGTYIKATKDNVIVLAYSNPGKKYDVKQGQHILIPAPGF
jgi:hypothetical protein